MPMHVRVCAGGRRWGCATWVRGSRVPHQWGCPHWGMAPQHVRAPRKRQTFRVPCCWEHHPALQHRCRGWAQQSPPPPRVCPCSRTALPQGCHQPIPARLHPWVRPSTAFCPVQGTSHHHVPRASAIPPCSLARCAPTAATVLRASPLQAGASSALPRAAEPA